MLNKSNKSADEQKQAAAKRAMAYIKEDMVVGIGTGSTTEHFIRALGESGIKVEAVVASSVASEKLLKEYNLPLSELNQQTHIDIYVDGADECTEMRYMIKGGGGALVREKIIATFARQFICIADESKLVGSLGRFPVAVEVVPMARSVVAKQLIKLGGEPIYREGYVTDNGNVILDVHHLTIEKPIAMEEAINNIPGVVGNGIFALRPADMVLLGEEKYL